MRNYLLLAAAALTFAACGSDETDNWNGEIRLRSGLDVQQTITRAANGIQATQFDSGEKIDVYITEATQTGQNATTTYDQPLIHTTGESGTMTPPTEKKPYYPTSGNGVNIFAIYPSGTSIAANNTFTIQTDQSTDAAYKKSDLIYGAPSNNATVSRTKSTVNIEFEHLLSKVTIELKSGAGNPDLNNAVVKLKSVLPSTTLTASNSGKSIGTASGTATDIKVMKAATDAMKGSAVVIPQTFNTTHIIEVTLANGGVLTTNSLTSGNDQLSTVTLEAGKSYTYTITVNLTSLDVKSSITDWNTGGSTTGVAEMQ